MGCTCNLASSLSCAGTLIRRHRIPRPPPNDEEFYTVEDFNVDKEIVLHGKKFQITVRACHTHVRHVSLCIDFRISL